MKLIKLTLQATVRSDSERTAKVGVFKKHKDTIIINRIMNGGKISRI